MSWQCVHDVLMPDITMMVGAMAMAPVYKGHKNEGGASGKVLAAAIAQAVRAHWTGHLEGCLSVRKGCK